MLNISSLFNLIPQKTTTSDGRIVRGTSVFVKKSRPREKKKGIIKILFLTERTADRSVSTKNIVKNTSKFPDLALYKNQKEDDSASADNSPTTLLKSSLPKKYVKIRVKKPQKADAALTPNSLYPKSFSPNAISQNPAGGWSTNGSPFQLNWKKLSDFKIFLPISAYQASSQDTKLDCPSLIKNNGSVKPISSIAAVSKKKFEF